MNKEIRICFVCTGNTCRSIMAERILKKIIKEDKLSGIKVSSRGLDATGENIAENAKIVLKKKKANAGDRKSIKLKKIDKNTLYITMTEDKKKRIDGKVICMKDLLGYDILDPYMQGVEVYEETINQIERGIIVLLNKILKVRAE